jgi:hypothetical protein
MPTVPPGDEETAADSTAKADEGLHVPWALVAAGLILALVWLLNSNRAWATPLVVAGIATLLSVKLLARKGLWSRGKGVARSLLVVALLVGFFLASGGWAYTYGGGAGLTITLEAPSDPIPSATASSTGLTLNYSFTNAGTDRLRFDPGGPYPSRPPVLRVFYSNGTRVNEIFMPCCKLIPPFGGWPDSYVELGPGESFSGIVRWPIGRGTHQPVLTAGDYTAQLSWSSSDCSYSWLPCFVGELRSNDVVVNVV